MVILIDVISARIAMLLGETQRFDDDVDRLDADERNDDAADAIDQQVAGQNRGRAERTIRHAAQRERNQRDDDQRVENDRRQNRALRASPDA